MVRDFGGSSGAHLAPLARLGQRIRATAPEFADFMDWNSPVWLDIYVNEGTWVSVTVDGDIKIEQ